MTPREYVTECVFDSIPNDMLFVGGIPINVSDMYEDRENLRLVEDLGMDSVDIYGLISDVCYCLDVSPGDVNVGNEPKTIKDIIDAIYREYEKRLEKKSI